MLRRFLLASASPRRRELLALLGLPFEVIPGETEEPAFGVHAQRSPAAYAESLAIRKAWDLFDRIRFRQLAGIAESAIVLAADTIVVRDFGGDLQVLGKPSDEADARRMLALLSGATHTVSTAVCLMECDWSAEHEDWFPVWKTRVVETEVAFRALPEDLIDAYLATGEPFDKAGAYGIQGFASTFAEAVYGDYFNVVGLPVSTVARMLEEIGIEWWRGPESLRPPP